MRLILLLTAVVLAGCGGETERAGTPAEQPKASATPSTDELRETFAKEAAATEPPLRDRAVRRCFLKAFDRYDDERFREFVVALERTEPAAQQQVAETAQRCSVRAGTSLGATQDAIAERGADVGCALKRLRHSLTPAEREKAAAGRLSDKAANAVANAVAACS